METVAAIVAKNVGELRRRRQLSVRDLSDRLGDLGSPMLASAVSKIENGQRKVTVDDLVALAAALDVSPVRLLMPGDETVTIALTGTRSSEWQAAWRWAAGEQPWTPEPVPITDPRVREFVQENRPFEGSPARELPRWLVARVDPPFSVSLEIDREGRIAKGGGIVQSSDLEERYTDGR